MDALGKEGFAAAHLSPEKDGLGGTGKAAGQAHHPGHLPADVVHVFKATVGQVALEAVALPQGPFPLALHFVHLVEGEDHPLLRAPVGHRGGALATTWTPATLSTEK